MRQVCVFRLFLSITSQVQQEIEPREIRVFFDDCLSLLLLQLYKLMYRGQNIIEQTVLLLTRADRRYFRLTPAVLFSHKSNFA